MKAIIMAGGEGMRLRPLTCDCPKPMLPLFDRPIMEYAILLLARHGITRAGVTLGYQPEKVTEYFGRDMHGVDLAYYVEDAPCGTAGGVRRAKEFLNEPFIVLSGDGVTDLDIEEAAAFHRERGAMATIVLKRVEDPLEYGVVVTGEDGRVERFLEKPDWRDAVSDTVNTGIYILEPEVLDLIPGGTYDFGRDLFPEMVKKGLPVFGYVTDGYWCDVGSISAYLACHMDALDGKIDLPGLADMAGKVSISPDAIVDESATIMSPCWIGPGARVEKWAEVGEYTVLGECAHLSRTASAKRSLLMPHAKLCPGSSARAAILGRGARMEDASQAFEGAVLGTGATASARSRLLSGCKIWPGKRTEPGSQVDGNLIWGGNRQQGFLDGGLPLSSPIDAARAGEALAYELRAKDILLARAPSAVADAMWHAVAAGIMAQGSRVLDAGVATLPSLRFTAGLFSPSAAAYVTGEALTPLALDGAPLSPAQQKKISSLVLRQDFARAFSGITRPTTPAPGTGALYAAALSDEVRDIALFPDGIALYSPDPCLTFLAEEVFRRVDVSARVESDEEEMEPDVNEIGIWIDGTGGSATLAGADGALSESEMQLLIAWTAMEMGEEELFFPPGATHGAEELARSRKVQFRFAESESIWQSDLFSRYPRQARLWYDGLWMSLSALSALGRAGLTLGEWRRSMPRIHRRSRMIELSPGDRGRVLRALSGKEQADGSGWASILPDSRGSACRLVAESYSMEHSRELFDFMTGEIARVLKNK